MRGSPLLCSFLAVFAAAPLLHAQQRPIRFEPPPDMLPAELLGEASVSAGDLDSDLDLFLVDGTGLGQDRTRVWWNEGAAGYREERGVPSNATKVDGRAVLVDLDRDGDPDLVAGGFPLQVYVNQYPGSFVEAATGLAYEFPRVRDLVVEDFNGDGNVDVFQATAQGDRFFLASGGNPWQFSDQSWWLPPSGASGSVIAADWEGLGTSGVAVLGDSGLRVLKWEPTWSTFELVQEMVFTGGACLASADVNGDGAVDLFVGGEGHDRILLNDGTGLLLATPGLLPTVATLTTGAGFGDLDRDGDPDLVLSHDGDQLGDLWNRVLFNDGRGNFHREARLGNDPTSSQGILVEDLDLDGDLDVFIRSGYRAGSELLLGDGTGAFHGPGSTIPPLALSTWDLQLAEFDGQPGLDAIAFAYPTNAGKHHGVFFFPNDGSGRFRTDHEAIPASLPSGYSLGFRGGVVEDWDGDGLADLFLHDGPGVYPPRYQALLINVGGAFRNATDWLPDPERGTGAAAGGDLDGDGDPDLILGDGGGNPRRLGLLLNRGDGRFEDRSDKMPPWDWPRGAVGQIELVDVDHDHDLDAIIGPRVLGGLGTEFAVFLNDGRARFTELSGAVQLPPGSAPEGWRGGDFDGDGDWDLIGLDAFQGAIFFLPGDGLGHFGPEVPGAFAGSAPFFTTDLEVGDLEGDGDLDVVMNTKFRENRVFLNDGGGSFQPNPVPSPEITDGIYWYGFGLGDVDEDGDMDILQGGGDFLRLLLNLDRQVRWRALPRAGKPLEIEVHGTAGGGYTLFSSARQIDRPTPYGRLRVDLRALTGTRRGILDADGSAVESTPIPPNPALIGTRYYLQALLDTPMRLSNLEVAEITAF